MQALVRVQSRVLDQHIRLSHDGIRKSTFSDTTSLLESRYLLDLADRMSIVTSRDGSSIAADDWDDRRHIIEEVKAMLQSRNEAALNREKTLCQQIWRSGRNSSIGGEDELEEKPKWLDRWMATRPWDSSSRGIGSTDQRDPIKTVEIDISQPYSYLASNYRRSNQHHNHQQQRPNSHTMVSPLHRSHHNVPCHQSPATPSPSKTRPLQIRSASPRCQREDRSYNAPQTPSLRSNDHYTGALTQNCRIASTTNGGGALPNYVAATESAKACVRSQSAPRQRPSTPERERNGSAKKQLSYPVPPDSYGVGTGNGGYGHHQNMRSPSFKSVG